MGIDYLREYPADTFLSIVEREYFTGNSRQIVTTFWDPRIRVLYVAARDGRGVCTAHMFQDRGSQSLAELPHRGVVEFHETDGPAFASCSPEFLKSLSPPEGPLATEWRRLVEVNHQWLDVFIAATNGSQPGDRIVLKGPGGKGFSVLIDQDRRFVATEGNWPGLARAVDLLARGYQLQILRGDGSER